jgi:hypothetical protein
MPTTDEHFAELARAIFIRWERWRIAYNVALVGLVFFLSVVLFHPDANWYQLAWRCAVGACVANLCYFAGPTAEVYLAWLGLRSWAILPILFAGGLLFAMLLAAATVASTFAPSEF